MKFEKIEEIVVTFLNGNITDTKKAVKGMSKQDLVALIDSLASRYEGMNDYAQAIYEVKKLLE